MIEAETNDHNRQGKRISLNRVLEPLVRKPAPVRTVTIVVYCHGNLVQVKNLVNRTVDLLTVNVGKPVDSQVAPPVIPQGVSIVAPANRALTVGQLRRQNAGDAFPVSVSKATAAHAPANRALATRSEPVRHTKSDPAYLPFIDNTRGWPDPGERQK